MTWIVTVKDVRDYPDETMVELTIDQLVIGRLGMAERTHHLPKPGDTYLLAELPQHEPF